MAYKLIAIDLDDTLLTHDGSINDRASAAIEKAVTKGIIVVLCTGRTQKGAQRFYDDLGLDSLLITTGGAEIFDGAGNALYTKNLDPHIAKRLLEFAYSRGIHANVYVNGDIVFRERNSFTDAYEQRAGYTGIVVPDLLERELITPKVLYFASEDILRGVREDVEKEFPQLTIVRSYSTFLEFQDAGVNKGSALEYVADQYGVKRNETIAIGDTEIDIPMLKYAGLGVAVENGDAGAKQAADIVCASNDEGGVADVIYKYILEA